MRDVANMLTREQILERRTKTRVVSIPDVGEVKVRALTRAEALEIRGQGELDISDMEQRLLALGLVEPELTREDIAAWYDSAPAGELSPVSDAIAELSGLATEAAKAAVLDFRG